MADLEEERRAFSSFGMMGEEADGAIGMLAVDDAGARADAEPQAGLLPGGGVLAIEHTGAPEQGETWFHDWFGMVNQSIAAA